MSNIANLWTTYGVTGPALGSTYGIREDLGDFITLIDPDDYPTVASLEKTTTNGLYHEWLTDVLAATSTAGAAEGDSFSATSLNTRTRYGNTVQRFRKDFAVSLDQIELSKKGTVAGVHNEMDYQATKASKEVLRNIDARLWSLGLASVSASGASATTTATAATFQNLRGWSSLSYVTGASEPAAGSIISTAALNAGTNAKVIQANASGVFGTATLYALHQQMYVLGARPDTLYVSPYTKQNLSRQLLGDAAAATSVPTGTAFGTQGLSTLAINDYLGGGTYGPVIEYVKTDYGRSAIVMDRWIPRVTGYQSLTATATATPGIVNSACWALIEKAKVRLAYWRPLKAYPIAPQGDFMAAYMLAALTLEILHPSCVGLALNALD